MRARAGLMQYRILGPLEVVGRGGGVRLAAPRQRIVLAMLLLAANRVVMVERLVEAVWDETPPPTGRVVQAAVVSLTERRLALLEESIEVGLQLGQHHELIGELLQLTGEYPLRERLVAHLMTALYRDGRQAEALDSYRQTRDVFVAELGLEPGRDLRRLEQAILTESIELETPLGVPTEQGAEVYAVPRLLPADIADFTGRGEVLVQV